MMRALVALTASGLVEMVRTRVYVSVIACGVLLVCGSIALTELAVGEEGRVLLDLGLAYTSLVTSALAVAIPLTTLARELRTRDAQLLLSRPIARWVYVVGRFASVAALTLVTNLVFAALLGGLLKLQTADHFVVAVAGPIWQTLEAWQLSALAVFFGVGSSPAVSSVVVVLIFVVGRLSPALYEAIPRLPEALQAPVKVMWRLIPDLGAYDLTPMAHGAVHDVEFFLRAAVVALCFISGLLLFASVRLERRAYL
jgi:hypothetical protein